MRQIIEIQEQDLPQISGAADQLREKILRLIDEIDRDHWNIDHDEEWAIAFGEKPNFPAFRVKGHLRVIVDEILPDLATTLRDASTVTDEALVKEWQENWQGGQPSASVS